MASSNNSLGPTNKQISSTTYDMNTNSSMSFVHQHQQMAYATSQFNYNSNNNFSYYQQQPHNIPYQINMAMPPPNFSIPPPMQAFCPYQQFQSKMPPTAYPPQFSNNGFYNPYYQTYNNINYPPNHINIIKSSPNHKNNSNMQKHTSNNSHDRNERDKHNNDRYRQSDDRMRSRTSPNSKFNSYERKNNRSHHREHSRSRRTRSKSRSRTRTRSKSKSRSTSRNRSSSRHRSYRSNYSSSSSSRYYDDNRREHSTSNDRYYHTHRSNSRQSYESSESNRYQSHSSTYNRNRSDNYQRNIGSCDEKNRRIDYKSQEATRIQQKVSYVQTTLIPIYYTKDETNPKLIKGTDKLTELCKKFENDILDRSRIAREKANIPPEKTQIPDYRQLLQTKRFAKFTRCTCDQPAHNHQNESSSDLKKSSKCKQHRKKMLSSDEDNESRSSSVDSASTSFSSSKMSSTGSSDNDSENNEASETKEKKSNNESKEKKKETSDDEFDDIRSMEINRKQNHPERLHPDLSFNEPDQTNEGPLCKCKLKNTTFGTRHQIYYGEEPITACDINCNNSNKLFHYRMNITPFENFLVKHPTVIEYDKNKYLFEGYSILSHEPLENMPDCVVVIYNNEYKLNIVKEDMIENYTVNELELIKKFIFTELLELYDIKWKGFGNDPKTSCNRFHILPRFCRNLPYDGKEILSPCELLRYFLNSSEPVISSSMLSKCHLMSNREWLNYLEPLQGSIVTCPGKRPAAIRLDQVDRDNILELLKNDLNQKNSVYPLIIHFSMFRNTWLPMIKNNMKLKKVYHRYFKLRHLLNNKSKLTVEDKAKFRALGEELQNLIRKSTDVQQKEVMIELSSENFYRTGIRTDVVQQSVLIPTFIEHIRFHLSLKFLESKIDYKFKNRLLLQHALTHPSGAFLLHQNLGSNSDHIRNVLFNCKVRNPNYGKLTPQKRKSMLRKKGIHMLFSIMSQKAHDNEELSCISNYERLEYLGDKILELLTSKHLFFMFPLFDEGQLSEYRNAIVQNQYLAVLARKLDMHYFILFYHGVDLCSNSALNHALANSFEALLAAIFLDSDLNTVSNVLARALWQDSNDLYEIWKTPRLHPLQAQLPNGDRHLIPNTKILQHVNIFEDMIGVEFKHIRLLAQAFCTRSASYNLITLGDNQRLEFLGDTVLNFVVSEYLYRFFPNHHEGHLSLLRSSLVCNSTQALLYDELGMSDFVLTSYINNKKETNGNLKRKADVFEAFIGALYIDQGLEAVSVFCNVCMFNKLKDIILYQFWNDPKSRLQQCCLSLRDVDESKPSLPIYKLIEEKGPPNHKQYKVAVYFNRKRIGEGIGKSIHDAEVEAAKHALKTNADMFPVLNKYIANELKNSEYFPEDFMNELDTNSSKTKKKKNKNKKFKKTENASESNNLSIASDQGIDDDDQKKA